MEPNLTTSLIGLIAFSVVIFFAYRYASGNWNVYEPNKTAYENWTVKYGRKAKRSIILVAIIYYSLMLLQISKLL